MLLNLKSSRSLTLLLLCLILTNCSFISKPDTCECSRCPAKSSLSGELKELVSGTGKLAEDVADVCACKPWNRSLIKVEQGQTYVFSILEETEEWVDGSVASTPETGWLNPFLRFGGATIAFLKRSDKANWYALVGALDSSDADSFAIFEPNRTSGEERNGSLIASRPITMTRNGELYFYANDMNGRYFNNKGGLRLHIRRIN